MIVIGDDCAQKYAFCYWALRPESQLPDYIPSVFDHFAGTIIVNRKTYNLIFWDSSGQSDLGIMRTMAYGNSTALICAFSMGSVDSLNHVETIWVPEVRQYCQPDTPIILVGTNYHTSQNYIEESEYAVSEEQIADVARRCGNLPYFVVHTNTGHNVKNAFDAAIVAAIRHLRRQNSPSIIRKLREKAKCLVL